MHPHKVEDAHHDLREDTESVLKIASSLAPLVEDTQVEETIVMHKYSRLINTRRTTFNFTGDACKFHDGLQKSRHRYIENLGAFNVDEARLITSSYTIQSPERRTSVSLERQTHQPRAQISERMARKLKNRLPSQIRGEYEAHSQRDITDGKRHLEKLAYSVRRQPARFRIGCNQ